jgi:CheY-like chemotaxis protein
MKILFLDDDETRHTYAQKALIGHDARFVRTAKAAIEALTAEQYDVAMLDHDLGGLHYTPSDGTSGYAVARAIADGACVPPKFVVVHSYNPAGAHNMLRALTGLAVWAPFGPGAFRAAVGND